MGGIDSVGNSPLHEEQVLSKYFCILLDDVEIDLKKNHSFKKSYAFYSSLPVREWDSSVAVSSISVTTNLQIPPFECQLLCRHGFPHGSSPPQRIA